MTTLLAIDAGTTGVTACLFDAELRPVARSYREFAQSFPKPGWVEHSADAILAAVDATVHEILDASSAESVAAIGITNQRETVFAIERSSGKALAPGIVWQDRRTSERCAELRAEGRGQWIRKRTGLTVDPYFSASKIEWMLANDAALRDRVHRGEVIFGTVDTLVVAHLTGGSVLATDPTNASRTMLFGLDECAWDPDLCELFGVPMEALPDVRGSVGDFGVTDPERTAGRAIPIRGIAGDQQSALFGQGCFDTGGLKGTFGTGSFLLLNTGSDRVDSDRGLLTTIGVSRTGEPCFALEGSVFVCGALVQWLRDGLGLVDDAADIEALAETVEDCAGVTIVPAFTGLGAPYWDSDARGAILGLTRGVGKGHIARAALEAIALQNAELIELLREESGLAIEALLADGGAARNDLLMQFQADLAGVRVDRPHEVEATARGAALLAGLGCGVIQDPGSPRGLTDGVQSFSSAMDGHERQQRLAAWRTAVERTRSTRGS